MAYIENLYTAQATPLLRNALLGDYNVTLRGLVVRRNSEGWQQKAMMLGEA